VCKVFHEAIGRGSWNRFGAGSIRLFLTEGICTKRAQPMGLRAVGHPDIGRRARAAGTHYLWMSKKAYASVNMRKGFGN